MTGFRNIPNFDNRYFITKQGVIYNTITQSFMKPDKNHSFKLVVTKGKRKAISLKQIYKSVYGITYCKDNIPDLQNEIWRYIDNTNFQYLVSNYGRVKSYKDYEAKLLIPHPDKKHLRLQLTIDGKRKDKYIHRLVAQAFLPSPQDESYILHHIDTNINNNRVQNLTWVSPEEHYNIHRIINKAAAAQKENITK